MARFRVEASTVAWLALAALIASLEYDDVSGQVGNQGGLNVLSYTSSQPVPSRQLAEVVEDDAEAAPPALAVNLSLPCLPFGLLKPCGNVTVGPDGVDLKTPFRTYHIPGTDDLKPAVLNLTKGLERWTKVIVILGIIVYALKTCCVKSDRDAAMKTGYGVINGNDPEEDDDDDTATQEDKDAEAANRLDPKSPDFIAPGNIYRVLAILHPGKIGFTAWGKYATKAFICGYMQLFIPYKIIIGTFHEWEFEGIKSPLWFANNAVTFGSMCASLLSVCNLFAGKCCENIKIGQEANFFILSHEEPAGAESASAEGSDATHFPKPTMPKWAITLNENFWCTMSLLLNISMSFLLYLAMFVKIATFTGAVDQVAVVAVALYFIFDLDGKVMEADPKLKTRYRRAVVKQTVEKPNKPTFIRKIGNFAQTFISATVPLGLIAIIMFGWKNPTTGVSIGGDGITY